MNVTYFGHSCFLVELEGAKLLFDPFITPNPAAAHIDVAAIEADYVLLTHGHADHVADAADILERTGATLIANFEVAAWFEKQGVSRAHAMNHGGCHRFPFGAVKMVSAIHSSSMPDGSYGGNPAGFIIESPEVRFYVSGDTALTLDMKLIKEFHALDWAALCIGDNFTMGARDAARCAQWIGVNRVLGLHYDTFPPICIDHDVAKRHFRAVDVNLLLPAIGEKVIL
jgi:L-ascorbate metabolism protein UlaG (beta-lactamase superfamily)